MKGQKTGGRKKGSLNRQTVINNTIGYNLQKDGIVPLLQYVMFGGEVPTQIKKGNIVQLLEIVKPECALLFVEKLLQFAVPKMQSTTIDLNATVSEHTIEDELLQLSAEAEP